MKNEIPEYFVALVKQYANLSSNEQACRAIENVSDTLQKCLDYNSRKLFFHFAPDYLEVKSKLFLISPESKNKKYDHTILIGRLKKQQNMTDSTEVNNLLKAYLKAVCIVIGPQKTSDIKSILPVELSKLN